MAYIVNQDIIDRVGNDTASQLTEDEGTGVNAVVLDEVRGASEGEIDSYLSKRYATPIDFVVNPELASVLKSMTLDVAVFRLHQRRPRVSPDIRLDRDNAIKWAESIAEGKINLAGVVTPASTNADDPGQGHGSAPQNLAKIRESS